MQSAVNMRATSASSCSYCSSAKESATSHFMPRLPSFEMIEKLKAKCAKQLPQDGQRARNMSSSSLSSLFATPPPPYRARRSTSSLVSRAPSYESDAPITYINAIAFDGGGVRGASAAKIMDILMNDLTEATGTEAQAADYFDMFGGTSTGGLIAMMLGRLRVPTKTLIATYTDLSSRLFNTRFKLLRSIFQGCKYSGKLAETLYAAIVADNSSEGPDAPLRNTEFGAPDVFVAAVDASDASGDPLVIRSYDVDDETNPLSHAYRIADAALATTAAPAYFPAKTLGNGKIALDGGLAVNNPTDLLISEARRKHGRGVRFGLLLSVGTGEKAPMSLPTCSSAASLLSFTKAIGHILTDSEKTHLRVEDRFRDSDLGTYLRINVPVIGDVRLDEYMAIPAILEETEKYMNTPEMLDIRKQVVEVLLRGQCRSFSLE